MSMRGIGGVLAFYAMLGCGSSPQSRFYALSPEQGAPRVPPDGVGVIEVREPSLPGYLDRRELVTSADRTRIRYAGADRWAEPLARMLGRVLAADLRARLPETHVLAEPSSISLNPDEVVELSVQTFDRGPDGRVSLVAQVVVGATKESPAPAMRAIALTATTHGGNAEMVATMNHLVGRLADSVAELLVSRTPASAAR